MYSNASIISEYGALRKKTEKKKKKKAEFPCRLSEILAQQRKMHTQHPSKSRQWLEKSNAKSLFGLTKQIGTNCSIWKRKWGKFKVGREKGLAAMSVRQ